jgi:endonuclease YncB( thermonuclease family)
MRPDSPGPAVRHPASLFFWMIIIAVVAAVGQGLREFGVWTRVGPHWDGPRWTRMIRPSEPPGPPGEPFSGRVYVVDGDTIDVAGDRVRLFGIDAPERYQDCRDGRGRDYFCGRVAARALAGLIGGGRVTCTPVDRDRYDRDVALCSAGGRDLSEAMVAAGQAIELAQYSHGRYAAAEREARTEQRGIWAGSFELPAEWRRRHPR